MTITRNHIAAHLREIADICEHDLIDTGVLYMAADLLDDDTEHADKRQAPAEHDVAELDRDAEKPATPLSPLIAGMMAEATEADQLRFVDGYYAGRDDKKFGYNCLSNLAQIGPYRRGYKCGYDNASVS